MIAHLRGRLIFKRPNQAVIETGGVGYDVAISVSTFSELPQEGSEVSLFIHTHVREDAIALFGFLRAEEKQRRSDAQAASDALDPFQIDVDLGCSED